MARATLQRPEALLALEVHAPTLQTRLAQSWRAVRHALDELYQSKTAWIGAMLLLGLFAACLLTPSIDRYSPIKQNYREMLQPPSAAHYFGTDRYGRDIWARVLWGGRRLVTISLCAVAWGLFLGVPLGALSGYYGGWIDTVVMRCVDTWLAIPGLLLFLVIVTIIRDWGLTGIWIDVVLVFALGLAQVPRLARLGRGSVLAEKEREYVEAARVMGEGNLSIALRQLRPNCLSPIIVQATVYLGFTILVIAALAFLGLGAPPPTPDWGYDLNLARDHMETPPCIAVFPGLAISYAGLALNLFGDGLRDRLEPRLTER